MAQAVTMKVPVNGSLKHLLGRFGHKSTNKSNQIKMIENHQGIEIAIGELTGPADCSTDYLEVSSNELPKNQIQNVNLSE